MKKYFKNTDLEINQSHWKSEISEKYILFPPLIKLNIPLYGIQFHSNSRISRMDFELIEINEKLVFHDLFSDKKYYFELDKNDENKFHFSGESGKKEVWNRQPIEKTSDWLK